MLRFCFPPVWLPLLILGATFAGAADAPDQSPTRILNALNATEWIYDLDSARIDATIQTTRPPETVAINKRKFVKELRDIGADIPDEIPDEVVRERASLQSSDVATVVLAWDRKRLVQRYESPNCLLDVLMWDGLQGRAQQKWGTRQNEFFLYPQPPNTFGSFFSWLPWAMTADHYAPLQVDVDAIRRLVAQRADGRKDESQLRFHSVVTFDDAECELHARPAVGSWDRYYVEQATGRLRGIRVGSWGVVMNAIAFPLTQELLAARGIRVSTSDEAEAAVKKFPASKQASLWKELHSRLAETFWKNVPDLDGIWTVTLNDWREVQPGRWFPFRQKHYSHAGGTVIPQGEETRVTTVDRFEIQQPLDNTLFALTIDEGARVYDETHNPPLRYTQDSHRTPEEWSALIDEARKSQAADQAEEAALEGLIGSAAPDFPEAAWLNSDPLTWQQLSGKYVLLDFWHVGCGPCWAYIPVLQSLHDNRSTDDRLVVIGIHGSGIEAHVIQSELKTRLKFAATFPTCIDRPLTEEADAETYPSQLFHDFAIRRMPYAWLVGPDGKLIAHGDLQTLQSKARELLQESKNQ